MPQAFKFGVFAEDKGSHARLGQAETPHGVFDTPAFMPVGTRAVVKTLTPRDLEEAGAQIVLCNAYHLALRPGEELVKQFGGLHKFMNWPRPILTDSGGYQVFSLADSAKVTDDGVSFASPVDGAKLLLTPERAVEIQRDLAADIIMPFDECVQFPCEHEYAEKAMVRTVRWAERSLKAARGPGQALFGIVQGGVFRDLRERCVRDLTAMEFDGYAIGGLSVGEGPQLMQEALSYTAPLLPADKPRYLMGVGTPCDLLESIEKGVDMFDCVLPTRNGRNGVAFTSEGLVKIRNSRHRLDESPLDRRCECYACRTFSRAYLRHLFVAGEMLGLRMMSLHNVTFFLRLMRSAREAIAAGAFAEFKRESLALLSN
ncbi:MAG: tRNA guanosine(34) transglycosylase Tgt [Planctomycetes bacterium]|nr:tRNA guanosine(34) transglycosylase Tgt [Planctomycetota bacterium]